MFEPKEYQKTTLKRLAAFLEAARYDGPKAAFDAVPREVPPPWNKPYAPLEQMPDTPYLCLRLPTGGGKTFLAAQAVKVGARFLGREHNPLVLWLVPTEAIRQQTLETLTKRGHPNRQTLTDDFGENKVRIVDIADVTDLTPQDYRDKACIVIGTFAALRVERTEGRKFYAHTEALEPHFAAAPPNVPGLEIHSEGPDKGRIKKSCANLMALIRPLVIVDEAHNAKTDLSYDVLNRVRAGCVIEFTATPAVDSNVLHHVSASILKDEAMIKLPIILAEKPSWQEALTDSILQRTQLDELARNEKDFVRPIVLIQAESKDREVTVEVVEKYLVEQGRIEKSRIAIATGSQRDLDGVNLLDPACKIEFVITVQALKEGWDCPFAYVFCSVATVHSEKDVEQLLGRVLRMPWAQKRSHPALNWAYAFVSKACWPHAVSLLHDRLVHMGFDEVEAIRYLKPVEPPVFPFAEPPRERALREKIESYWAAAAKRGYQQSLFAPEALVETSFDYSFAFDPESYPAARHYPGGFQFPKHFDPEIVAAFDNDEELECAKAIEMCPHVVQWARNVPGMFGLPVWSGTFYPDFVAQLDDGRRLVVEYKGAHLIEHDQPKKNVGELWERTSGGKALFLWATKKDSSGRDVARQLEDKIAR